MDQIIQSLHLHNWYALAALVLTLAVQIFRKAPKSSDLWLKIPNGWRWLIPVLSGAITGFTQAFAAGLSFGTALLAAAGGAIGISIPAMGLNSLLTESPVKWNGGAGGLPVAPRMFQSDPPGPNLPSNLSGLGALLLAVCFAFHATACASFRPSPKTIADVARDLCSVAFAERHAAMSPTDIAKDFCATEKQLDPFVQQLLAAKRAALAPPEEAKKAPVLTGCDAAIENSKRLGCTFEATDAGGWCSTLKPAQVSCAAAATNCLATRKCTEVAK